MEAGQTTVKTKYWHRLTDGRVQCDLCPRFCKLEDNQRGFCFVRQAKPDGIVMTSYGRCSGFAIDPIEKKPLFHFLPGSRVLSFGTVGCNLGCRFCQNWDISKSRKMDTAGVLASPEMIARHAHATGCKSVAFTYNDPVIFMEYAIDTAKACHDLGLKTVAVTAGQICPEPRREFFSYMDAANIDLKGFTEDFYQKMTFSSLATVLDTLVYVKKETKTWLEITTLLIPGQNDSEEELELMSRWICKNLGTDVPLHFSAFHPDFKMQETPATPLSTLQRARQIAQKAGVRFVYTGNVHDPEGESTTCSQCNNLIVRRDRYCVGDVQVMDNKCRCCSGFVAGVFA